MPLSCITFNIFASSALVFFSSTVSLLLSLSVNFYNNKIDNSKYNNSDIKQKLFINSDVQAFEISTRAQDRLRFISGTSTCPLQM